MEEDEEGEDKGKSVGEGGHLQTEAREGGGVTEIHQHDPPLFDTTFCILLLMELYICE